MWASTGNNANLASMQLQVCTAHICLCLTLWISCPRKAVLLCVVHGSLHMLLIYDVRATDQRTLMTQAAAFQNIRKYVFIQIPSV